MKDIYFRIYKLPKELQDIIYEFNVEHRPLYGKVLKQILAIGNYMCDNCEKIISKSEAKIKFIFFQKYRFCSSYCSYNCRFDILNSFKRNILKRRYKLRVKRYKKL